MKYRNIGGSDLTVSLSGLGCNNFGGRLDAEGTNRVVARALDHGVTFFDTADSYGGEGASERLLGEALAPVRDEVIIASKFGWQLDKSGTKEGCAPAYVLSAVEASLSRLNTDRIDFYQMHVWDEKTPIEDTLRTLEDLITAGKVRYIGCSGLNAEQLKLADDAAASIGSHRFIASQDHYNMLTRGVEAETIPALESLGMSLLPYAPLASGLLSGKYRRDVAPTEGRFSSSPKISERYLSKDPWDQIEALTAFAEGRGHSLLDLAIAWVAAHPVVCSIIAGAMTPEQVDANIAAAAWELSAGDMDEIAKILG